MSGNCFSNPHQWPGKEFLNCLAFAQHYGVPTRLLDWSRNPYVAAYFAATEALRLSGKCDPNERFSIWVLDTLEPHLRPYKNKVQLVEVNKSIAQNMAAQTGLFTLQSLEGGCDEPLKIQGLEDAFSRENRTVLFEFTLPYSECGELYRICKNIGITAATLFPTADGARKATFDNLNYYEHMKSRMH